MCDKQITLTIPADSPEALEAARDFFDRLVHYSDEKLREQIEESKAKCLPVEEKPETSVREFDGGTIAVEKHPEPVPITQSTPINDSCGLIPEQWITEPMPQIDPIEDPTLVVLKSTVPLLTLPSTVPASAPAANIDMAPARTLPGVVIPWDERIHSRGRTKTANGCWTTRRQCSDDVLKQVEFELAGAPLPNHQQLSDLNTPAPVAPVHTPAAPVAPVHTPAAPVAPVHTPAAHATQVPTPAAHVTQVPTPAAPVAPVHTPAAPVAPVAPTTVDPSKFTFQDMMATTNKLGYKDFQKIQELGAILRVWSKGRYNSIPEIAQIPIVMHDFTAHIKQVHGVTE